MTDMYVYNLNKEWIFRETIFRLASLSHIKLPSKVLHEISIEMNVRGIFYAELLTVNLFRTYVHVCSFCTHH